MTVISRIPSRFPIPSVLVVDHDADNRALYRDSFTLAGWMVTEASDGRDGLVQALIEKPWVIVSELRLPVIDGISLCQILRRDRATAAVPILIVTSETRPSELARAQRAGADAVLVKPSTPDAIMSELQRLMERSRLAPRSPASVPSLPAPGSGKRTALVKSHQRISTTTPEEPPANLTCPICGQPLKYQKTFIGGVNRQHAERWDYFECSQCGQFQYRYRTRRLRHLS